ncbi:MAG: hypothetical protein HOQ05_03050 [Corynebacteriales bacterium]|nr:hypothetical protein [Mycobacteriales bacterium]
MAIGANVVTAGTAQAAVSGSYTAASACGNNYYVQAYANMKTLNGTALGRVFLLYNGSQNCAVLVNLTGSAKYMAVDIAPVVDNGWIYGAWADSGTFSSYAGPARITVGASQPVAVRALMIYNGTYYNWASGATTGSAGYAGWIRP